ncbi:MAG: hypothetical protein ACR2O4_11680 [Hyphomicrobiaceae bacterium]
MALITRSASSPVARALALNFDDLERAGVAIRVIFSTLEPSEDLSAWFEGTHRRTETTPLVNAVRWTSNPALIDAHEQLVLGNCLCWFGDAMRRDPATRDALETFNTFCETSANQTMRSFEAMWRVSQPIASSQMHPKKLFGAHEALAGLFSEDRDGVPTAQLPKRH